MTITAQTSLKELAFIVCTALDQSGTIAVLSGGGAATVYAPEVYQSRDLDFILVFASATLRMSSDPILKLGFRLKGNTYHHPESPFTLEFPAGPLAIGNDRVTEWNTIHEGDQLLHLLTPTDCVRDRLAWFLFNSDHNGLSQAVGVANTWSVNLDKIKHWCEAEGEAGKYEVFRSQVTRIGTGQE